MHPEMKLVLRFELHPAELDQKKKIPIQLRDDEGRQLFELAGDAVVSRSGGAPLGEMVHRDQILGINGMRIERAGPYEFVVLVNGEVKGQVAPAPRSSRAH